MTAWLKLILGLIELLIRNLWKNSLRILIGVCIIATILAIANLIIHPNTSPSWMGMKEFRYTVQSDELFIPAKTLWDWMNLLIVPAALALGIFFLNYFQRKSEQEIALDRQHQTTLEAYFDRMENLLLKENLRKSGDDEVRGMARTRTLDVLRRIDGESKGHVLQFLHNARLIRRPDSLIDPNTKTFASSEPIVSLEEADLKGVNLSWAIMTDVFFYRVYLQNANMHHAHLNGAYMVSAILQDADMRYTDFDVVARVNNGRSLLLYADFTGADLRGAKMNHCNLIGANLSDATLQGANMQGSCLDGTVLSERTQISVKQLSEASSFEYAFSWNPSVANQLFVERHKGTLDTTQYPQPFSGGNWSLARYFP